jgi:hypothetical protein
LLDCSKERSRDKICAVASASRFAQTTCLDIVIVPDPYQLVLSEPKFRRRLRTIVNVAIVHNPSRLRVSYPELLPTFTL